MELYPSQKLALKFLLKRKKAILALDMGMGKTIISMLWASYFPRTIVVCPAPLKDVWRREYAKFLPNTFVLIVKEPSDLARAKSLIEKHNCVIVMNYETLSKAALCLPLFKAAKSVIVDEAHAFKNISAKRTKMFYNLMKESTARLCLLTGTPITNRVPELYMLLKLCDTKQYKQRLKSISPTFKDFAKKFAVPETKVVNGVPIESFTGVKNVEELQNFIRTRMLRMDIGSCIELPPLEMIYMRAEVSPQKLLEADKRLSEAWEAWRAGKNDDNMTVAKQNMAILKVPTTLGIIKKHLGKGESIVVFSDFILPLQQISGWLARNDIKFGILAGPANEKTRKASEKLFQLKKIRVLLCSISVGKEGFTLTAGNILVFNDLSWVPARNSQSERRIYRLGQTKPCKVYKVLAGDVDNRICEVLEEKNITITTVLEGITTENPSPPSK